MTQVCDFAYSPDNLDNLVRNASDFIMSVYQTLAAQTDLTPNNAIVNNTLTELVTRLQEWENNAMLSIADLNHLGDDILIALPELCAKAECAMENWWAKQLLSGQKNIEEFWYLDNYRALVAAERKLLYPFNPTAIVFVGSGPLPLTAILLAKAMPHLKVTCVDSDAVACELSREIFRKYQLSERTEVIHCLADDFRYAPEQLVICASLLRSQDIFHRLYAANVRNVLSRDVEGMYHFLYRPAVKPQEKQYREIGQTHLNSEYINVSRIYERV